MRAFLDECVDWRLARDIIGHDVKTARQMGWTTVENVALLTPPHNSSMYLSLLIETCRFSRT